MDILTLLMQRGALDQDEVATITEESEKTGKTVDEILIERGISTDDVLEARSEQTNVPTRKLEESKVPYEVLAYIPQESAVHYKFVPIGVVDGVLEVGIVDPDNIEAIDALNFISTRAKLPYKIFLISESDFQTVLEQYKGLGGEVGEALSELETELSGDDEVREPIDIADAETAGEIKSEKKKGESETVEGSTDIKEDAPVTKIVATVLRYAVEGRASDIHIEPVETEVRVRYRVDGVLHTSITLPKKVHRAMVARIKILSSMRLDERRKPQDGRFSATISDRKIDFRVSTFPTRYGEKVVMRILDREQGLVNLESLGLSIAHIEMLRRAVKHPYGIILISGPTGSGKSTTLYSMLSEVDRIGKNVLSLEDPVEYNVEGISQSQVRPEIGYTFASGLRSVLRQDPDVIMVGEIRDKETAQLAIQAALTGHLVLSTIHTNTAVGVIPRLVDMGVDPYLIAPTLVLAVAQRLVSKLCEGGGKEVAMNDSLKVMVEKEFEDLPDAYKKNLKFGKHFYEPQETAECPNGVRGRVGVFEILEMTKELERQILENPTEDKVYSLARGQGMFTMREDAIMKAFQGIIPFQEINTLGGTIFTEGVDIDESYDEE